MKPTEMQRQSNFNSTDAKRGYPTWGVVLAYYAQSNTVKVILTQPDSDEPGEILHNVPCPTNLGIQAQAPKPGTQCMIAYKAGNPLYPMVTHFFNYYYDNFDFPKQTRAKAPLPRFMMDL